MKILLLCRYSRMGQSSRLRTLQYIPYLKDQGIEIHVAPLFDDSYLSNLHAGKRRNPGKILLCYLKRSLLLRHIPLFDILWIEKEILPWVPFLLEKRLLKHAPPVVIDIDDADFHHYDINRNPIIRFLLGAKIARLMRSSDLVTAGNAYLAEYAERSGAECVVELPTVVDIARYTNPDFHERNDSSVTIGWIGSPTTADYLKLIAPALAEVAEKNPVRLVLVGSGDFAIDGLRLETYPWTEDSEVKMVSGFDIGIMPLAKTPWELGKCGYKIIQYMACSKPVVATAFGANPSILNHGREGFLADGVEDWKEALSLLVRDKNLRLKMGAAGRRLVEERYCTRVTVPRLLNLFKQIHLKGSL